MISSKIIVIPVFTGLGKTGRKRELGSEKADC